MRKPETPLDWLALLIYGTSDTLALLVELLKRLGAYLVGVAERMQAAYGEDWNDKFAPVGRIGGVS